MRLTFLGYVVFNCQIAMPSENDSLVLPPFLRYAAPGVVKDADLVYANYGNDDDFVELEKRNITCSGWIVMHYALWKNIPREQGQEN